MAIRGRRPTAPHLRLIKGDRKRRRPAKAIDAAGKPERPAYLTGRAVELWNDVISRATWLAWPDGPKAGMWCSLQAEFEASPDMLSARIAQLRALGSELGLDPSARARLGADVAQPVDELEEFNL
jgi:phage terminase small subunit